VIRTWQAVDQRDAAAQALRNGRTRRCAASPPRIRPAVATQQDPSFSGRFADRPHSASEQNLSASPAKPLFNGLLTFAR
jgi:hypothetical protein